MVHKARGVPENMKVVTTLDRLTRTCIKSVRQASITR